MADNGTHQGSHGAAKAQEAKLSGSGTTRTGSKAPKAEPGPMSPFQHDHKGRRFSWVRKLMNNGKTAGGAMSGGGTAPGVKLPSQRAAQRKSGGNGATLAPPPSLSALPTGSETASVVDSSASVRSIKSGRANGSGSTSARLGTDRLGSESIMSGEGASMLSSGTSTRVLVSPRQSDDELDGMDDAETTVRRDSRDPVDPTAPVDPAIADAASDDPQSFTVETVTTSSSGGNSNQNGGGSMGALQQLRAESASLNSSGTPRSMAQGTVPDAASIVTLASSTRNLKRRKSIDTYASTNASTTAIPPASIMEKIPVDDES